MRFMIYLQASHDLQISCKYAQINFFIKIVKSPQRNFNKAQRVKFSEASQQNETKLKEKEKEKGEAKGTSGSKWSKIII